MPTPDRCFASLADDVLLEKLRTLAVGLFLPVMPHFMDVEDLIHAGWLGYRQAEARADPSRGSAHRYAWVSARWAMRTEMLRWYGTKKGVRLFGLEEAATVVVPPVVADEPKQQRTKEEERWQLVRGAIGRLPPKEEAAIRLWLQRAPNGAKAMVRGSRARQLHLAELRRQAGKPSPSRLVALRSRGISLLREALVATCALCGGEYVPGWRKARFCSKACANHHTVIERERKRGVVAKVECEQCHHHFRPRHRGSRFCSKSCSDAWLRKTGGTWAPRGGPRDLRAPVRVSA